MNHLKKLPILAFVLDVLPVLTSFLGIGCIALSFGQGFFIGVGLIILLLSVCMPFVGISLGIFALSRGKDNIGGTRGVVLSVIAIALPIVVVAVTVILFSTGVLVIRFM